jgi:UDP-N-acetylglucosamine--N-acetylmuramyl-(pentapeptide) pyrophosphoryl-undecaprenol N-acetylglucosamine transferase
MVDAGAAEAIEDAALSATLLAQRVTGLFADRERLTRMSQASRALARPHAARHIADEVLAAAGAGASGAPFPRIVEERRTGT